MIRAYSKLSDYYKDVENRLNQLEKKAFNAQKQAEERGSMLKHSYHMFQKVEAEQRQAEAAQKKAEDAKKVSNEVAKREKAIVAELKQKLRDFKAALRENTTQVQQQTEQIKNLTTNFQKVVEDQSGKEVEWKRQSSSSTPRFLSLILLEVHQQIIEEYKESDEFVEEVNIKAANEFNEGFEYAKMLVRENGLILEDVGIVNL